MRNIFDQYEAPENRLTHALGCCLRRDPKLIRAFVSWLTGRCALTWHSLEVLEQQVPGAPEGPAEVGDSGLPDLWIHGDGDWSLIIESKVQARINSDQLRRHERRARRNGFTDIDLVVLAPEVPMQRVNGVTYKRWPEVYCWLRQQAKNSPWAACAAEYFEVAEARMTADGYLQDGSLTEFDGIPFGADHPYSYREAKRLLKLAMAELRMRRDLAKFGMDADGKGRPAITGRDDKRVWDFVPLRAARGAGNFTAYPHLTISIQAHRALAVIILPNAVGASRRKNLAGLSFDDFRSLVSQVEHGISKAVASVAGAYPYIEAVQRHYPSQKATPIEDARLEFDLRTATGGRKSRVKQQPQWLEAVHQVLQSKKSNLQVGIGAVLPYGDPSLHSRDVLDVIAGVWIGCGPWIRACLGG